MLQIKACVSLLKPEFIKCKNDSFYIEQINQVMADQSLVWVAWPDSDSRTTGVASVRSFQKLPLCLTKPRPDSSKTDKSVMGVMPPW